MKLGEFFIDLVVDAGSGELTVKSLISSMGQLEAVTVGQIGALFHLGNSLAGIADISIDLADRLHDLSSKTNVSTVDFQKWQAAAHKASEGAGKAFPGVIDSLDRAMEQYVEFHKGEGMNYAFSLLGIDPHDKTVFQFLDQVSEKIKQHRKNPARQREILEEVHPGLSNLLPLLRESKAQREHDMAGAYVMSEADQKKFNEIRKNFIDLGEDANKLGHSIVDSSAGSLLIILQTSLETIKEIKKQLSTGEGPAGKTGGLLAKSGRGWGALFTEAFMEDNSPNKRVPEFLDFLKGMRDKKTQQEVSDLLGDPDHIFGINRGERPGARVQTVRTSTNTFNVLFPNIRGDEVGPAVRSLTDSNDLTQRGLDNGAR